MGCTSRETGVIFLPRHYSLFNLGEPCYILITPPHSRHWFFICIVYEVTFFQNSILLCVHKNLFWSLLCQLFASCFSLLGRRGERKEGREGGRHGEGRIGLGSLCTFAFYKIMSKQGNNQCLCGFFSVFVCLCQ